MLDELIDRPRDASVAPTLAGRVDDARSRMDRVLFARRDAGDPRARDASCRLRGRWRAAMTTPTSRWRISFRSRRWGLSKRSIATTPLAVARFELCGPDDRW
jgi:hypothetical protein